MVVAARGQAADSASAVSRQAASLLITVDSVDDLPELRRRTANGACQYSGTGP